MAQFLRSRWFQIPVLIIGWIGANVIAYSLLTPAERQSNKLEQPIAIEVIRNFEALPAIDNSFGKVSFRLLRPPSGSKLAPFPLILFLHGAGQKGTDNQRQLRGLPEQMAKQEWSSRYPCFLLAPQCPPSANWSMAIDAIESTLLRTIAELPVDRQRIYVTGLSMGGYGVWELTARRPELFAAAAPICGGGDPAWSEKLASIPIWAVHGDNDPTVPVEQTRAMIRAIVANGGSPHYVEMKGVGHESWIPAYRDPRGLVPWMFEQKRRN